MTLSSNALPTEDPILWDVVEEHLDEADFLLDQWTRALDSPRFTVDVLAKGFESRLLAQLDGLVVGGPAVAERLLEPAALTPESPRVARAGAASIALLGHGRQDAVVRALLADDAVASAGAKLALALAAPDAFDDWLRSAVSDSSHAPARARLLNLASARGLVLPNLLFSLQSPDADEVIAACAAVPRSDAARHMPVLDYLLDDPRREVASAATVAALVHGSRRAFARCLEHAADSQHCDPQAMLLVALLGTPAQHQTLLSHLSLDSHRAAALCALGYTGQTAVVDNLVEQLSDGDSNTRKLAAEAIATITGLDTSADAYVLPEGAPEGAALPLLEEDLETDLVPTMIDELPEPNVAAIAAWWHEHAASFDLERRLLLGVPWTAEQARDALSRLPLRRCHAIALWWLVRSGGRVRIDTRAFSSTQRAHRAAAASADLDAVGRRYGSW